MTTAYRLAVQQAAREYDPKALHLRNCREGLLNDQYAEQFRDVLTCLHFYEQGKLSQGGEVVEQIMAEMYEDLEAVRRKVGNENMQKILEIWYKLERMRL